MCSGCDGWKQSGLDKRDFRHSKDGPEEITRHPKRRNKKWCKKEGREHVWEQVVWYSYKYTNPRTGDVTEENRYRWACKGCGKTEYYKPRVVPEHKHCYCDTKIDEWRWRNYQEISERCCVCGSKGRSYKFYTE